MQETDEFTIAGDSISAGSTKTINLTFSESYLGFPISIPIRVIRSLERGPIVFVVGGIHGNELNGMGIIRQLIYYDPPALLKGTLICIPVVNIYGLENHTRYLPDRRDLNRSFPGQQDGSLASRLAYTIYTQVIRKCDFGIDLHSAAIRRTNYPNVRGDLSLPGVDRIAQCFGCELVINSKGPKGSLRRTAIKDGIPTIIFEAGEVWKIEPSVVNMGVRGCMNILKHLGMAAGEAEAPLFQVSIRQTVWLRSNQGGILEFHAKPGDLVHKDQEIAANTSIFGRDRTPVTAPTNGIILGMTTMPAVKPGEPIYHLAKLTLKNFRLIRDKLGKTSAESSYKQTRDDLATSVTIQNHDKKG